MAYEDYVRAVQSKILGSKTPGEEIRRLYTITAGDPEATNAVAGLVRDSVLGREFFDRLMDAEPESIKATLRSLYKHRHAWEAAYGEGSYETARAFLDRVRVASFGKVGTPGHAYGTGSAVAAAESKDIALSLGEAKGRVLRSLVEKLDPLATRERDRVLTEAMLDKKFARDLLRESQEPIERVRERIVRAAGERATTRAAKYSAVWSASGDE
jgi:hypothetical protein